MAKNQDYGMGDDDDFDFDFGEDDNFDELGGGDSTGDREPQSRLKQFRNALREESLTPAARKRYIRDALPRKYRSTIEGVESITEATADLYNDSIVKEWEKTASSVRKTIQANARTFEKFRLGRSALDWANNSADSDYGDGYDAEKFEMMSKMGMFAGDLKGMLSQAQEEADANLSREEMEDADREATRKFHDVTIKTQTANFGALSRLANLQERQVNFQDQVTFNYYRKDIELKVTSLMMQARQYEEQKAIRAETRDALTAITKNTSLPDYAKITTEENAKRVLRDKFVLKASDWAGNKMKPIANAFIKRTQVNIQQAFAGMREGLEAYLEGVEVAESVGKTQTGFIGEEIQAAVARKVRDYMSGKVGNQIRKRIEGSHRASGILDMSESFMANSGAYARMALSGRSGVGAIDKLVTAGGYGDILNQGSNRIVESHGNRLDQAAYIDNRTKRSINEVIPGLIGKLLQVTTAIFKKAENISDIPEITYDHRFNRFRESSELQHEFNNTVYDEDRVRSYNDGMDRWIDQLDPDHTLTDAARKTVRRWLVENHSNGTESFAVNLYRGEGLPTGTTKEVKKELEIKIPILAGFDPDKVDKLTGEGVKLELMVQKQNPGYRSRARNLGMIDQASRNAMPIDNEKLARLTERYGANAAVSSGVGKYDKDGNVSLNNKSLIDVVTGGAHKQYKQLNELGDDGNLTKIADPDEYANEDDKYTPFAPTPGRTDKKTFETWSKQKLAGFNLPGFAKGGFTRGAPDEIAGVTHGGESVTNSEATRTNSKLLGKINKLSAPIVMAGGKLNRIYYDALGFKSPEEVDQVNEFKSRGLKGDLIDGNFQGGKMLSYGKNRLTNMINRQVGKMWYQDGYNQSMGPTPEFMGPMRTGGAKNNANKFMNSMYDYINATDAQGNKFNIQHRADQARDLANKLRSGLADYDYVGAAHRSKDAVLEGKDRVKAALRRANTSKAIDWDATNKAIEEQIEKEGYQDEDTPISLYMEGMRSPFITKHDFQIGRYRNMSTGKVISKLSDIRDDIVLVGDHGRFSTIATMADMLNGVFDSRGTRVRLIGLEEGHRRYLKRSSLIASKFRESKVGQMLSAIKAHVWDDIPVNVNIALNGQLVPVLRANMFKAGMYIDKETGDILKSHNDIQGIVLDSEGNVALSLEDIASGLFDDEGQQLKISKLKHWRNKMVTKIENKVKGKWNAAKNKVLDKVLAKLEGAQTKSVYVMRWSPAERKRVLTEAFTMEDLNTGLLIDRATAKTITKLSEITGPVYSKRTKSIVYKDDEIQYGLLDAEGNPLKDFKNMSVADRLKHQQDKAMGKLEAFGTRMSNKFRDFMKATAPKAKQEAQMDVYVRGETEPRIRATAMAKQQYGQTVNGENKFLEDVKDINGSIYYFEEGAITSSKMVLSLSELRDGAILVDSDNNPITIAFKPASAGDDETKKGRLGNLMSKIKNKILKNKTPTTKMEDLFKPDDMKNPFITATKLNSGKIVDLLNKKPVTSYNDLTQGALDLDDPDWLLTKETAATLVTASGQHVVGVPVSMGKRVKGFFGGITSKIKGFRFGSWQQRRAKKEEEARNKKDGVTVNVQGEKEKSKGFFSKLFGGLTTILGTVFGGLIFKFKAMFKSLRNAIMISKMATGAGGALAGGTGGGRGKLGLATKLAGAALVGYGGYKAYHAFDGADETDDPLVDKEQAKAEAEGVKEEEGETKLGGLVSTNPLSVLSNGGLAGDVAANVGLMAAPWLIGKMMGRGRQAPPVVGPPRPGLGTRIANAAGNAAGAAGRGLGGGAANAGRLGRMAAGLGRMGGRAGLVGKLATGALWAGSKIGNAAKGSWNATRALSMGNMARGAMGMGRLALGVGRAALMAGRILSGPIGWGLMAATWIGGKLYDNYKNKQNPIMRFRMAQYGYEFDDSDSVAKLLDLENLLKDYVSIGQQGPSIKDNVPEDKVLELFGVDIKNPESRPHVERFIVWFQKRFKPVYLSYVKQANIKLKKTNLDSLDEELSKVDKLDLLKNVHFTNPNNNPYMISAGPFADPGDVTVTIDGVTDAYKTALKYVEKMPDDKKTEAIEKQVGPDGKPVEKRDHNSSWLDATKKGISTMVDKTLALTKDLGGKTTDLFTGWMKSATDAIKGAWDAASKWLDDATGGLVTKISNAWNTIKGFGSDVVDGVSDAAGGAWGAITGGLSQAGNTIAAMASSGTTLGGSAKWSNKKNDQLFPQIRDAAARHGLNEQMMLTMAYIESAGNPNASNPSGAKGIYQFMPDTARQYGLSNPFDQAANIEAGMKLTKANMKYFKSKVGRDPEPFEVYLLHQQGIGGAVEIANAAKEGREVSPKIRRNMNANKGQGKTPAQFLAYWKNDYNQKNANIHGTATGAAPTAPSSASAPAATSAGAPSTIKAPVAAAGAAGTTGKTSVSKEDYAKLKTPLVRPPMMASKEIQAKYDKDEAARKQQLAVIDRGVVSGTHVIADKNYNPGNLPEATGASTTRQAQEQQASSVPTNGKEPAWITIAKNELGNGELKNTARANTYFTDQGIQATVTKTAWCAAFVSWCLRAAGYPTTTDKVKALNYANYGKNARNGNQIPYGAIGVINSHVFFCVGVQGRYVLALGGNQGKPGSVTMSRFPIDKLVGVRWPEGAPNPANASSTVAPSASAQGVQTQQQPQADTRNVDYNPGGLQEARTSNVPGYASSTGNNGTTQRNEANKQVQRAAEAGDMQALMLEENRKQTNLLVEIRDVISGQGKSTVDNRTEDQRKSDAQLQLVAGGIQALMTGVQAMTKANKGSLSDRYPVQMKK